MLKSVLNHLFPIEQISTKLNDDIIDNFEYKRKICENESYICHLIQNDSIDNIIEYIKRCKISFSKKIDFSIFETNPYLLKKKNVNLIKCATFFGSIRFFKYMLLNNASLESSLWMYTIHGNNPEIIHILEQYTEENSNVKMDLNVISKFLKFFKNFYLF